MSSESARIHKPRETAGAGVQSVDRALRLLKAVAASDAPSSAQELAQRCDVNRSTAWRLLATLESHGLVERDAVTGRYVVGYAAFQVATPRITTRWPAGCDRCSSAPRRPPARS